MSSNFSFPVNSVVYDANGLVPAIVQDAETMRVLMLGYMNEESLSRTLQTGKATFYSRSRQKIWVKGESSGNVLDVKAIHLDCDADTILIQTVPAGPTCHTGEVSCFFKPEMTPQAKGAFLFQLEELLKERKEKLPEGSYTTHLFRRGLDKIAQKVGEEAVETVIASKNDDQKEFLYESSDLLFHLMVLLTERGNSLSELVAELESRHKPASE